MFFIDYDRLAQDQLLSVKRKRYFQNIVLVMFVFLYEAVLMV